MGTDTNYWSTIMGVGYYSDVSQWDKGEYTGSNNGGAGANYNKGPDDLQIITNYTIDGVWYVGDLAGDPEGDEELEAPPEIAMSLYVPFDFDSGSRQLSTLVSRVSASNSGEWQNPSDVILTIPSDGNTQSEWIDLVAIAKSASDDPSERLSGPESLAMIDSAFSETEEGWLPFRDGAATL